MSVNKNDNLDLSKKTQNSLQDLIPSDKNVYIGVLLLFSAIYLINKLTSPAISEEVQGFLVVIIGLLLIVAIDFFKKDTNSGSSDVGGLYPTINNKYVYDYQGANIYQNSANTHYSSKENLEEVAAEIKEIIKKVSQNTTDSDVQEMPILEAKLIEEIKHNAPEETKDLTDKDLSIAAKTIETIEQDQPLKQRVMDALKAGGSEALKASLNSSILTSVASSAIIAAMQVWDED